MMKMMALSLLGRRGPPTSLTRAANGAAYMQKRLDSTLTVHHPHKAASREVPTPLLVLTAYSWKWKIKKGSKAGNEETTPKHLDLAPLVSHFQKHGWTVFTLDLDPKTVFEEPLKAKVKDNNAMLTSEERLQLLVQEMTSMLQSHGPMPFPPLLVSTALPSLVAETYVSSNPLSGLVLLDPPLTPRKAFKPNRYLLTTKLEDFTYEPRFPTLVAWTRAELDRQRIGNVPWWEAHRIEMLKEEEAGESLDRQIYEIESKNEAGPQMILQWAERECGMGPRQSKGKTSEQAAKVEDVKEYKAIELDKGRAEDDDKPTRDPSGKYKLPEWFNAGSYQWNPTGSKKEPLLLDDKDLEEIFVRGSGPGGQAINKLSICVVLKHLPTGTKVKCQETRSRELNREQARRLLSRKLEYQIKGKDSAEVQDQIRIRQRKLNKKKKMIRRRAESGVVLRQKHREFLAKHDNDPS